MIESPTILLLASDEALVSAAAASLVAAYYQTTRTATPDAPAPDLVLRQWNDDTPGPGDCAAPVLSVDLTQLCDRELVDLVDRVVGFPAVVIRSARRSNA